MDLFYGQVSGNSARAVFGLLESGAPFTPHLLDTRKAENQSPGYLAVNPMGKIPALADGSFRLWESNAITLYAAEKHPASGLIPQAPESRASMHRWLFFQAAHVSPSCVPLFRATNPQVQAFWQIAVDDKTVEKSRNELARWLPVLDAALTGREWLEGVFSLADIAYAPHLWMISEGGFDFSPYPALSAWLTRLLARPAWAKTTALVFGR